MKIIPDSVIFVLDDLRSIERNDDRDDRVIEFISVPSIFPRIDSSSQSLLPQRDCEALASPRSLLGPIPEKPRICGGPV